jgi:hypothetical protein
MDASSPEFVAGRAVAVVALERLIRARTALVVWTVFAVAAVLVVGAVMSDGLGAIVVGLAALVAASVAMALFAVRAAVLRALRRIAGGPHYARVRPIVERRMAEVQRVGAVIPLDAPGALRLAWRARRPADLQQQVRETAATVARTIPDVVADVRRELETNARLTP